MSEIDDLEAYETPRGRRWWLMAPMRRGPVKPKAQRLAEERARWQQRYDNDPEFRARCCAHSREQGRQRRAKAKQKRVAGVVGEAC